MHKDDIKLFVRKTLGCTCPEEVFERVDCRAEIELAGGIVLDWRIDIGGRLLIFVVSIGQSGDFWLLLIGHNADI